jgi:hypothetical protein
MYSSSQRKASRTGGTEVSIRFGRWFEAHATGWGVLVVGVVALGVLTAFGLTAT